MEVIGHISLPPYSLLWKTLCSVEKMECFQLSEKIKRYIKLKSLNFIHMIYVYAGKYVMLMLLLLKLT